MEVLLIYDVSDKKQEVKTELKKLGYKDFWYLNETILNFPDNILSTTAPNTDEPIRQVRAAIETLNMANGWNISLVRCIAIEYGAWSAVQGSPIE
ncbi:MAG: hypothetical protein K1X86_06065 [Ignavibacteria bacterium]|nr:hypothetical protein [Ignavibacteria bacterium]